MFIHVVEVPLPGGVAPEPISPRVLGLVILHGVALVLTLPSHPPESPLSWPVALSVGAGSHGHVACLYVTLEHSTSRPAFLRASPKTYLDPPPLTWSSSSAPPLLGSLALGVSHAARPRVPTTTTLTLARHMVGKDLTTTATITVSLALPATYAIIVKVASASVISIVTVTVTVTGWVRVDRTCRPLPVTLGSRPRRPIIVVWTRMKDMTCVWRNSDITTTLTGAGRSAL